jgi:hypothetical protein
MAIGDYDNPTRKARRATGRKAYASRERLNDAFGFN